MGTYVLNNQIPSFKQDEYNANEVRINVPAEMQSFDIFIVFALPSNRKVFTPKLSQVNGVVTYPLAKGITSEIGRVMVELQGYLDGKYIKSATYTFNIVKGLTTSDDPDQADYAPWYVETVKMTEEARAIKKDVEGYLVGLPVKADRSYVDPKFLALDTDKADKTDVAASLALKADLSEIEAARGTEPTLGARLDTSDAQLAAAETDIDALQADKSNSADVNTSLALKANKAQEEWVTPTLLNGYTAINPIQYMKDEMGFVHFRGRFGVTGTPEATAFTLALGYRPQQYVLATGASGKTTIANYMISTSGNFSPYALNGSLDGITYKAV